MTQTDETKPCPFCGSSGPNVIEGGSMFYVACAGPDCFCALGEGYDRDAMSDHSFSNEHDAIAAWNTRAIPPTAASLPLLDELEAQTNPQALVEASGDVDARLGGLCREYRPTMDRDVLHSWAQDIVQALEAHFALSLARKQIAENS